MMTADRIFSFRLESDTNCSRSVCCAASCAIRRNKTAPKELGAVDENSLPAGVDYRFGFVGSSTALSLLSRICTSASFWAFSR